MNVYSGILLQLLFHAPICQKIPSLKLQWLGRPTAQLQLFSTAILRLAAYIVNWISYSWMFVNLLYLNLTTFWRHLIPAVFIGASASSSFMPFFLFTFFWLACWSVSSACISNDQPLPGQPHLLAVRLVHECNELLALCNYDVAMARSVCKAVFDHQLRLPGRLPSPANHPLELPAIAVFSIAWRYWINSVKSADNS